MSINIDKQNIGNSILVKVTNEQLMDKLEQMDKRILHVEQFMYKSKGAVSVIVWLAGISVIVGGYFYQK